MTLKNALEGFNNKFEKAEERIRKLQEKLIESIQLKELKRKRLKKQSLRELQGTIRDTNMGIKGEPEEERKKRAKRMLEEIVAATLQIFDEILESKIL